MKLKHLITTISLLSLFSCQSNPSNKQGNESPQSDTLKIALVPDSISLEKYHDYLFADKLTRHSYKENIPSYLTKIVTQKDTTALLRFLANHLGLISNNDKEWHYSNQEILPYLFDIDINGDGQKDIIYNGVTIGEGNVTKIIINHNQDFKKVFETMQDVIKMDFANGKLTKLSISNPGCCSDAQVIDFDYAVTFTADNQPAFKLINTIGYTRSHELPKIKYKNSRPFHIKEQTAEIRDCCFELNTEHPAYGNKGNMIAVYAQNAKGTAIAEKHENGTDWLFVLMDKENKILETQFPSFLEQPTQVYGWIKKKYTTLS